MADEQSHSLHPFLRVRPNGEYAYKATQSGDLRRFFEAARADPALIPKITKIELSSEYDDMLHSGVLDLVAASVGTDDGDDDYESEDQVTPGSDNASAAHPVDSTRAADPFETATDNFRLVNDVSGADISLELYDKLVSELLAVFVNAPVPVELFAGL